MPARQLGVTPPRKPDDAVQSVVINPVTQLAKLLARQAAREYHQAQRQGPPGLDR